MCVCVRACVRVCSSVLALVYVCGYMWGLCTYDSACARACSNVSFGAVIDVSYGLSCNMKYWVRCHGAERPQQDPKKSDCTPITFPATYFGRGPFILSDSEKHIQIIIIWMISSKQDRNKVPFAKILSEIISSKIGRVIVCHWTKKPYTLSLLGWEEGLGL